MIRIVIPGSVPEGKKSLRDAPKKGKFIPSSKMEAWSSQAITSIKRQITDLHLTQPASINIAYYTGDDKRREPMVVIDTVLAVLRMAGLVSHERLFGGARGAKIGWTHCGLNGRPRVEVEILLMQ